MKNKTKVAKIFHAAMSTQHVFMEDEQVFLKKETHEAFIADANAVEWFPTDFRREPSRL